MLENACSKNCLYSDGSCLTGRPGTPLVSECRGGPRNSDSYVRWPQASTRKDMSHGNAT